MSVSTIITLLFVAVAVWLATEFLDRWVSPWLKGWSEFIAVLPNFLPTCNAWEQWFLEVAYPAFATNSKEIFSRGEVQSDNLVPSISNRL